MGDAMELQAIVHAAEAVPPGGVLLLRLRGQYPVEYRDLAYRQVREAMDKGGVSPDVAVVLVPEGDVTVDVGEGVGDQELLTLLLRRPPSMQDLLSEIRRRYIVVRRA